MTMELGLIRSVTLYWPVAQARMMFAAVLDEWEASVTLLKEY